MITRVEKDSPKADSLIKMADVTLERLEKTDMERYPSNSLQDYYDVIHKLMEAVLLREGVKIRGEGAHQELIDYLAKENFFDESTRVFLQQMRDYRNRVSYEGFMVNPSYLRDNKKMILSIIASLKRRCNE